MTFSLSILATGSELLDGRVVNTNSNFVARELSERGLKLKRVLVVDDDMSELLAGLKELSSVSDFIITSGGLGPTSDDLTRDAVSTFCGVPLEERAEGVAHLEKFCAARGRTLDAMNRRQALLPQGALMVHNENGTAPGFAVTTSAGVTIVSLSGVPREFKQMFNATVLPMIEARGGKVARHTRHTMKIFGYPESSVGKIVESLAFPKEITVSYRVAFPEIHLVLKAVEGFDLAPYVEKTKAALGTEMIFTEDPQESFIQAVNRALSEKGATIATAESCTGGMVAEFLTRMPGSSSTFMGSVVAYSNAIKQSVVGVSPETLKAHGAVSAETVRELARGVREKMGTTFGVSVSGVAGPDGGTPEKPVGTFFVGVSSEGASHEIRSLYVSDRHNVRTYASYVALEVVRRLVRGLPLPSQGLPIFR